MHLVFEACLVGLLSIMFGGVVSYLLLGNRSQNLDKEVLLSFFISGVIIHFFCEISGINHQYCESKKE